MESFVKVYHNNNGGVEWSYKHSPFMDKNVFITQVVLELIPAYKNFFIQNEPIPAEIKESIRRDSDHFINDRKQKGHFLAPSAGSVFKNNRLFGKPSGVIVDEAGLKGLSVGGAQVAPWHGNFIINNGNAMANDVRGLVQTVQRKVKDSTGFSLETEIIFVEYDGKYGSL
jgi:UDP-N-acetylmuramate dehydrogenase